MGIKKKEKAEQYIPVTFDDVIVVYDTEEQSYFAFITIGSKEYALKEFGVIDKKKL